MKRLNYMRYASVAAVLGLCVLCAPVQASGIKGKATDKVEIRNNIRGFFTHLRKEIKSRDWNCRPPKHKPCGTRTLLAPGRTRRRCWALRYRALPPPSQSSITIFGLRSANPRDRRWGSPFYMAMRR